MDGSGPSFFSSRSNTAIAALTACAIAYGGHAALGQSGAIMVAIDKMQSGAAPNDFEFARTGQGGPGRWVVVADAGSPGGRAIEQASTDATDFRFPLAIYQPVAARNVDVTVRFKAMPPAWSTLPVSAVRVRDRDNYYVMRANALEDNVRLYRVVKGRREQLEGANLKVTANEWHALGLKAEGERLTVSFDGKALFTASDKTFADAGRVALWTKADSVTRFDQLKIVAPP